MTTMPTFFDAATIERELDYPGCIAAVRVAMTELSDAAVAQPLRQIAELSPGQMLAVMPGRLGGAAGFGAKVISVYGDPDRRGRSRHQGLVTLFDRATGAVEAIGEAGSITTIRTASASAVATDALARPDATTLGIFGSGELARAHISAIPLVRHIARIRIWARDRARADALARWAEQATGIEAAAHTDPREVAASDVLCTVTGSSTPILEGAWVRAGTHVNMVGSSYAGPVEVDTALVAAGRYIADSRASALAAAAELLVARAAGVVSDAHVVGEIGEVLLGRVAGRRSPDDITLYKSLGHIVQDLAALTYLVQRRAAVAVGAA